MSKVPNLRFPEFDGDENSSYRKHFFKDIFLFSTGKNIKQNEASPEFETPCVRYGELYHMYNEVINEVINKTNLDKSELLFSQGNEILLPSAGEDPLDIGSASALMIENIAIGRTINILKPMMTNVYSQIYVAYYINQKLRKKISTLAKGSSISNVYNSDLRTLEIILPSLTEQQKNATFLSLIDERIQTQSKIILRLESLIQNLRDEIFKQKLRF
jgi:type I restriction enzyme S subunit